MSLRKRGSTWWIDIVGPDGGRIRRSTGLEQKTRAQEEHDCLKAQLWHQARYGVAAQPEPAAKVRHTWQAAAVRWLREAAHKATIEMDKLHLRWLDPHLRGKCLDEISRDLVDQIQSARLREGVSNATVNRTLETLRAILRRAVDDWEWLDRAPKVRMLKEPKRRVRYLTHEEAQRLLSELPPHLADMAAFSLETGLRQANVTGLQWLQLDLAHRRAWIHPDQAKARKAIAVPLSKTAVATLEK
jgi:integrase